DRAEKLPDVKGATFAEPGDDSSGETSGNHRGADTDNEKRITNAPWTPGKAIHRVERPDRENFVRDIGEKLNRRQFPQVRMGAQQNEGANRIGPAPGEFFAFIFGQGFGDEEKSVEPVRQAEGGGNPKCRAGVSVADQSPEDRA